MEPLNSLTWAFLQLAVFFAFLAVTLFLSGVFFELGRGLIVWWRSR